MESFDRPAISLKNLIAVGTVEMSESEDEFPFDAVDSSIPACKNINPDFCKALFALKQLVYTDIVYSKDPSTSAAQDIRLLNLYETTVRQLHTFFRDVLRGRATTPPLLANISTKTQQAFEELHRKCNEERQNNDRYTLDLYKILVDNMFHTYLYDMGGQ